jgi:ARID/BRIGHT DNA binding domain
MCTSAHPLLLHLRCTALCNAGKITLGAKSVDFFSLHKAVKEFGGARAVAANNYWPEVAAALGHGVHEAEQLAALYCTYLSDLDSACTAHTLLSLLGDGSEDESTAVAAAVAKKKGGGSSSRRGSSKAAEDTVVLGQGLWRYFSADKTCLWVSSCCYYSLCATVFRRALALMRVLALQLLLLILPVVVAVMMLMLLLLLMLFSVHTCWCYVQGVVRKVMAKACIIEYAAGPPVGGCEQPMLGSESLRKSTVINLIANGATRKAVSAELHIQYVCVPDVATATAGAHTAH